MRKNSKGFPVIIYGNKLPDGSLVYSDEMHQETGCDNEEYVLASAKNERDWDDVEPTIGELYWAINKYDEPDVMQYREQGWFSYVRQEIHDSVKHTSEMTDRWEIQDPYEENTDDSQTRR